MNDQVMPVRRTRQSTREKTEAALQNQQAEKNGKSYTLENSSSKGSGSKRERSLGQSGGPDSEGISQPQLKQARMASGVIPRNNSVPTQSQLSTISMLQSALNQQTQTTAPSFDPTQAQNGPFPMGMPNGMQNNGLLGVQWPMLMNNGVSGQMPQANPMAMLQQLANMAGLNPVGLGQGGYGGVGIGQGGLGGGLPMLQQPLGGMGMGALMGQQSQASRVPPPGCVIGTPVFPLPQGMVPPSALLQQLAHGLRGNAPQVPPQNLPALLCQLQQQQHLLSQQLGLGKIPGSYSAPSLPQISCLDPASMSQLAGTLAGTMPGGMAPSAPASPSHGAAKSQPDVVASPWGDEQCVKDEGREIADEEEKEEERTLHENQAFLQDDPFGFLKESEDGIDLGLGMDLAIHDIKPSGMRKNDSMLNFMDNLAGNVA